MQLISSSIYLASCTHNGIHAAQDHPMIGQESPFADARNCLWIIRNARRHRTV
jgi:hypothetical protein